MLRIKIITWSSFDTTNCDAGCSPFTWCVSVLSVFGLALIFAVYDWLIRGIFNSLFPKAYVLWCPMLEWISRTSNKRMLQAGVAHVKVLYKLSWLFFDCLTPKVKTLHFFLNVDEHLPVDVVQRPWRLQSALTSLIDLAKPKISQHLTIPWENRSKIFWTFGDAGGFKFQLLPGMGGGGECSVLYP
jgi:hypothetical protein